MKRVECVARIFWIATIAFVVSACGTIKYMQEMPDGTAVQTPKADKAIVVFMRSSMLGQAVTAGVFEIKDGNPELVGFVANNSKLAYEVDPGKHVFMVVSETGDYMSADLSPGRTYYAFVDPRMGAWRARFSLAAVTKNGDRMQAAQSCLKDCRVVAKTPEAEDWVRQNLTSVRAKHADTYPLWNQKPEKDKPHLAGEDGV